MVNVSSRKRRRESDKNNEEETEQEYQVEAILDKRITGKKTEYLLKWQGYPHSDNTVRFLVMLRRYCFLSSFFKEIFFYTLQEKYFPRNCSIKYYLFNRHQQTLLM